MKTVRWIAATAIALALPVAAAAQQAHFDEAKLREHMRTLSDDMVITEKVLMN